MNTTPPQPAEPSSGQGSGTGSDPTTTQSTTSQYYSPATVEPSSSSDGSGRTPHRERLGDYAILRIIGEGGMGTVYLAEDVRLRRQAAIKTMKPEMAARPDLRERFVREARAAAAMEHDNIVPIWQ